MAQLTKQALLVENSTSFPNNNAGAITPSILRNFKSFITNKTTIKFHFDVFHGNGKLDQAIDLLDKSERDDFRVFITFFEIQSSVFVTNSFWDKVY